jgi:hypothetical protein
MEDRYSHWLPNSISVGVLEFHDTSDVMIMNPTNGVRVRSPKLVGTSFSRLRVIGLVLIGIVPPRIISIFWSISPFPFILIIIVLIVVVFIILLSLVLL